MAGRSSAAAARTRAHHVGCRNRADNVFVGACGLFPQETELELAYIISHRHRGQRYASEAAGLVLDALDAAGIQMPVYAIIRPRNVASRRVAEVLGFRCTEERTDDRGVLLVYRRSPGRLDPPNGRLAGPLLRNRDGLRMDRRCADRIIKSLALSCGITHRVHPHALRHTYVTTMLDAGVPLRDVQIAARHADPRTTTKYDRARQNLDRHGNYILSAFMASHD